MASFGDFVDSVFDSANTVSSVINDYNQKQAALSTQTKNIQLQNDINGELARIRQSNNFEDWNTEINNFYERVKSGMGNKNSPYYCNNNLQAEMFTKILDQSQVNVSDAVNNMVIQKQQEKNIVDTENSIEQIFSMHTGQDAIDLANESVRLLYENGDISLEQYDARKDKIFQRAYMDMYTKVFDDSFNTALSMGKSKEAYWQDIKNSVPQLKATDTYGLEKTIDKSAMDEKLQEDAYQFYNARLADVQQSNANQLSNVVQVMRQQNTAEGKLNQAKRGQRMMNSMEGLQLSESDRLKYSAYFELAMGNDGNGSGSSGSGTGSKKPDESFEKYLNAAPENAIQDMIDHPDLLPYGAAQMWSDEVLKNWFNKDYKENYDKDFAQRAETFNDLYQHKASVDAITNVMLDKLIEKYPTAANYLKNNCTKLISDIQKNPKEYGEASAGELADFMRDWILSAPANATDEDFTTALKDHVNSCYIERCKYMELKGNGNLKSTFNANKAKDIAQAAQLASEKDYVFTDQYGNERWAKGKKEALEAEGGIVNVLQNAVVGTLGIPESEYKNIGFYYQRDDSGHDLTNKPIITYKDKAYEVIPDESGKGFKVRDINSGEELEGKTGGKLKSVMRAQQKEEAKQAVKETSYENARLKKERKEEMEKAITGSNNYPKAMQAAGKIDKETWNNYKDLETRTYNLRVTANRMDSDAKKMTDTEFKNTYGIAKDVWTKDKVESRRFELILKS